MTACAAVIVDETVYLDRDNVNVVGFNEYDPALNTLAPLSWNLIARMVLQLTSAAGAEAYVIDSAVNPEAIDFTTNGQITFKLGELGIDVGEYLAGITAIDTSNDEHEIMNPEHPDNRLRFVFLETGTVP